MNDANSFTWDDEAMTTLRRLWGEGRSASQISVCFNGAVSRNAVLGKLHRLGLVGKHSTVVRPKRSAPVSQRRLINSDPDAMRRWREEMARRQAERRLARLTMVFAKDPTPPKEIAPQPVARMIPLLDLQRNECRFPFGEGPYLFCGLPTTKGSYCDHCHSIVYHKRRVPDSVNSESSVNIGSWRKSGLIPIAI